MTIDEAVALYRKALIAAFTYEPDSIDMSYVERDVAEFRKGWVACVLNCDDASKDRIDQLESEIAELRKDRKRLDDMFKYRITPVVVSLTTRTVYRAQYNYNTYTEEYDTPREAIDSAIKAAEGEGETS